jgi:hypothetical protein
MRSATPFVCFRIVLQDGESTDVNAPEEIALGSRSAMVIGFDTDKHGVVYDNWKCLWYVQMDRIELLPDSGQSATG